MEFLEQLRTREPAAPRQRHRAAGMGMFAALAACALAAGCGKAPEAEVVLAEIGPVKITAGDLRAEAERRMAARQPLPDRETLLREMAHHESMLQRARAAGLDRDPEVRRRMESALLGALIERELTPRLESVGVSEAEIEAEYEAEKARHTQPEQIRLAMLFLETGPKASEARLAEQRARMEEAQRRVAEAGAEPSRARNPRAFGALALDFSDDTLSRHRGGDVGWLQKGQPFARLPAPIVESAWALGVGEVSGILERPEGLYLLMKTDARPERVTPLDTLRASLRQTVLVRKRKELEAAFRKDVLAAANPQIHASRLSAVEWPEKEVRVAHTAAAAPPALPGGAPLAHGN